MKRVAVWAFYVVSALAILYAALNIYVAFRRPHLTPGEPIHIFRSPDGPNYS
jgi:bacteriorhodopsin